MLKHVVSYINFLLWYELHKTIGTTPIDSPIKAGDLIPDYFRMGKHIIHTMARVMLRLLAYQPQLPLYRGFELPAMGLCSVPFTSRVSRVVVRVYVGSLLCDHCLNGDYTRARYSISMLIAYHAATLSVKR